MNYDILNIFNQLPGYIGWKDKNFKHLGCNRNLAKILKLKNESKIIGLSDSELMDNCEDSDSFHKINDMQVLQGKIVKGVHKSSSPYDGSFYYFVKKPLLDEANHISGIIYHCLQLVSSDAEKILSFTDAKHYNIIDQDNLFNLSKREFECLFFILRGKTAKQTAEIMNLSKRTVETYIENLKNKFACDSKADLLIKAVMNGYQSMIPASLWNDSLSNFS